MVGLGVTMAAGVKIDWGGEQKETGRQRLGMRKKTKVV